MPFVAHDCLLGTAKSFPEYASNLAGACDTGSLPAYTIWQRKDLCGSPAWAPGEMRAVNGLLVNSTGRRGLSDCFHEKGTLSNAADVW